MILDLLKEYALNNCNGETVADVRIGLSYTAVLLDSGAAGVAMTFHRDMGQRCVSIKPAIAGKSIFEIIEKANSSDLIQRTVAIAAINAILNKNQGSLIQGDTIELLKPGKDDIVGMVGSFGPLIPKIKGMVKALHIFKKTISEGEDLYPAEKAFEMLPLCSMAIITSTSLINRTFEKIAHSAQNCRKIVMVGGSTPFAPEIFAGYGIDLLSGIIIKDTQQVLRIVSESGGMKAFKGHVSKVNIFCNTNG